MKRYVNAFVLAVVITMTQTSVAANLTLYQWSDELCENEGYYNAALISKQNIDDGFEILRRLTQVNLPSYAPYRPADLEQLDSSLLDKTDSDYLQADQKLRSLTTASKASGFDMMFFKQKLRQDMLDEYHLKRLGLMVYLDIDSALSVAPAVCQQYLTPLTQGDNSIQAAWRDYTLERIRQQEALGNDSFRVSAMERYRLEKSQNEQAHAKLDLIGYAWHNCLNRHHSEKGLSPEQVNIAEQAFKKVLFNNTIKSVCEMP